MTPVRDRELDLVAGGDACRPIDLCKLIDWIKDHVHLPPVPCPPPPPCLPCPPRHC